MDIININECRFLWSEDGYLVNVNFIEHINKTETAKGIFKIYVETKNYTFILASGLGEQDAREKMQFLGCTSNAFGVLPVIERGN